MFDKANSFRRSLYALVNIADQYVKLGNYEYAEEILEAVIISAKSFNLDYILSLSYNLMSLVKLSKKADEEALELSELSLENKPKWRNDMYFNIVLACYRLGKIEKAKEYIEQVFKLYRDNEDAPTYLLVNYLDMLVNDNDDETLMYYLKSLVNNDRVKTNIVHKKFVVSELLSIYERNRKYKEAFLLCKTMSNLD
jgi:tetratricopeptide (TPR) repeat protein